MPTAARKACSHPGCPNKSDTGRCPDHRRQLNRQNEQRRGNAHQRGYTSRWQKARIGFLAKHPLCAECERNGTTTAATIVDHIIPHKRDWKLFWTRANWQGLCKPCHDKKTARQDGGFGRSRAGVSKSLQP